jgi:hypothetical protein
MAGYSSTPLPKKLGITEGSVLMLIDAPDDVLLDLPSDLRVKRSLRGQADVVVAFFTSARRLEQRVEALADVIFPDGGLWIAWPKRSSALASDLSDQTVRELALLCGLVDNKVCAIDETWSALRVVWRTENR